MALQKLLWALVFLYITLCYIFYYGTWTLQLGTRTIQLEHRQHVRMFQSDSGLAESSFALILVGLPSGQWTRYLDELAIDSAPEGRKSLREKTRGRQINAGEAEILSPERDVRCDRQGLL